MTRPGHIEDLERRLQDIEQENSNLASLYVALSQLHSTLDVNEVLNVIVEILLNFVGADTFAVMVVDSNQTLRAIASHGVERARVPSYRPGEGTIGRTLETGEEQVEPVETARGKDPIAAEPLVCIPLHAAGATIGVLPIWTFLPQKTDYSEIDHEIIALMARSAGTALEAARLSMTVQRPTSSKGYYEAFEPLLV
jgi:transcriptional regulator with GAF, ATPase, and Fis domain